MNSGGGGHQNDGHQNVGRGYAASHERYVTGVVAIGGLLGKLIFDTASKLLDNRCKGRFFGLEPFIRKDVGNLDHT